MVVDLLFLLLLMLLLVVCCCSCFLGGLSFGRCAKNATKKSKKTTFEREASKMEHMR